MIHLEIRRMTLMLYSWCYIWNSRTHRAETSNKSQKQSTLYLKKGVLIRCGKFTGEYPCRGVISIKLQSNFIKAWLKQLSKVSVWGYSSENLFGKFSWNHYQGIYDGVYFHYNSMLSANFYFRACEVWKLFFERPFFWHSNNVQATKASLQNLLVELRQKQKP